MSDSELTGRIIGAAIEVHRELGPGLLESAYAACLEQELKLREIAVAREVPLPVRYKGLALDCGYRLDMVVEGRIVVEIKAVRDVLAIHEAQLLSYLKLGGWRTGLLMNFHEMKMVDGVRRMVWG